VPGQQIPFGTLVVDIVEGDLAAQAVDAVVNAANNHFWMGAGVAGALRRRGGPEVEREAVAQGPVAPGASVITTGGALPARHVIQAAVMGQDLRTDERLIAAATRSALDLARARGLTTIAFPALGTGVGGFPIDRCAEVMLGEVKAHADASEPTTLARVVFVLFGADAYDAFRRGAAAFGGA
jgi:O-acetyl-ADP-ribose deacetylase (regulator of RNase III)